VYHHAAGLKSMNALLAPRPQRIRSPIGFIVVAILFYVVDGAIVHSQAFLDRPEVLAPAASIDLTFGVTLAYWLLVVRPGHAALRTVLPVFVLSVAAAALTLPSGHRDFVRYARYLGIPFELAVITLVVVGIRRTHRRLLAAGVELDVPERIEAVLADSPLSRRVGGIVATEMSMLFYALASWGRKPFLPASARAFSYHRQNAYAAILYTVFFASLVELSVVHVFLRTVAPRAALAVLVLSAFGAVWILGFARAVQLRPIVLTGDELRVRSGLQWRLDIPRSAIARIEFGRVKAPGKRTPGYLRAALGAPNALVTLREPLRASGAYGMVRDVTGVGLVLDDVKGFQAAIERRAT
jgi:hypothetical protein